MSETPKMKVTLNIWRQSKGSTANDFKQDGKMVRYELDHVSPDMSFLEMLDVLNEHLIQKGETPVAFDHDCREGICGSCGVVIDGVPHGPERGTTTCQLHMRSFKDGAEIWIEPWRAKAFPVLKDLVVDRSAFDRVVQSGAFISVNTGAAQDANAIPVPKDDADKAFDAATCIGCGACVAACKNASAMLFVGAKVSHFAHLPQGQVERERRARNLVSAMDKVEADRSVGAVVVTGAAPAFCAGANLGNLAEATAESLGAIYEGFLRIARSPLPTIAAVNGAAVGAGMNMALACDVRLAAERAKFDTRFLQIGIHPGGGHTWMMRRILGPQATFATVVFGEVVDGREAERIGLVWKCVADDQLMPEAMKLAMRAAETPRDLLESVKKTIKDMADVRTHPDAVKRELDPQVWSTRQPWFAERIAALQKKITKK